MSGTWLDRAGTAESPFAEDVDRGPRRHAEAGTVPPGWPGQPRTFDGEQWDPGGAVERESAAERRQKKCAETWKAFRDNLSDPMKKALDAAEWIDAVRWGIHGGIRDVTQLTNIVFQEWFGSSRGYCKLDPAEPKFEYYRRQWKLITEQHVRPAFTFTRPPEKA